MRMIKDQHKFMLVYTASLCALLFLAGFSQNESLRQGAFALLCFITGAATIYFLSDTKTWHTAKTDRTVTDEPTPDESVTQLPSLNKNTLALSNNGPVACIESSEKQSAKQSEEQNTKQNSEQSSKQSSEDSSSDKNPLPPEEAPTFNLDQFIETLVNSSDPIAELKLFTTNINLREQADKIGADADKPLGIELYLAHALTAAGLFHKEEFPQLHIIQTYTSQMLFIRIEQKNVSDTNIERLLKIESVLNSVLLFSYQNQNLSQLQETECTLLNIGTIENILKNLSQLKNKYELPKKEEAKETSLDTAGTHQLDTDGEWAVRHSLAEAIETLQLPFRLVASFRTNVADGNVAIEIQLPLPKLFPTFILNSNRKTNAIAQDRQQKMFGEYGLRLALLLAKVAFDSSKLIQHVWVAGVCITTTRRDCYYSVDFDRVRFSRLDFEELAIASLFSSSYEQILHPFCPTIRIKDGWLYPIEQTFALNEERFCPRRRYESISLSSRQLDQRCAASLGTTHVSGLAIDEQDKRTLVANDILRKLSSPKDAKATQKDVKLIQDIAGNDPDPSVRSAAERCIIKLTQGRLSGDPYEFAEEFVEGDELTRTLKKAHELLRQKDNETAVSLLKKTLLPLQKRYEDSRYVVWRFFATFVDRALYNRLANKEKRSVMLVPKSYFEAELLLSVLLSSAQHPKEAEIHAQTALRLAPFDSRSHLQYVRCLENQNKDDKAAEALRTLLKIAHDPQGIGTAYYRMAYFQWKQKNYLATQACYELALHFIPQEMASISTEMATLSLQSGVNFNRSFTHDELIATLASHDIPQAPSDEVSTAFIECAQASLNAEIFPVARNFMSTMTALTPDDITFSIMRSLEEEPDSL